jgi:hypothetical protein
MVLCKCGSSQLLNRLACQRQAPGTPCWPLRTGRQVQQSKGGFMRKFAIIAAALGLLAGATGQLTVERTLPDGTTDVETLRLIFFETG